MLETIREDIAVAFERDPAARSTLEVMTCYPGLHAIWMYRVSHALWKRQWYWLARLISHIARWLTGIEIHPGATIGRRFFIDHGMGVVIGETTEIGDDVTLYHGVTLGGTTWEQVKRHPTLGDGVVVGTGAKVLGAITIGKGSRIGSNSVVLKDVPECSTVIGIPGVVVGKNEPVVAHGRINLNHHQMPDPVAEVLRHMLKLIDDVNQRIDQLDSAEAGQEQELRSDMKKEHRKLEKFIEGEGI